MAFRVQSATQCDKAYRERDVRASLQECVSHIGGKLIGRHGAPAELENEPLQPKLESKETKGTSLACEVSHSLSPPFHPAALS